MERVTVSKWKNRKKRNKLKHWTICGYGWERHRARVMVIDPSINDVTALFSRGKKPIAYLMPSLLSLNPQILHEIVNCASPYFTMRELDIKTGDLGNARVISL